MVDFSGTSIEKQAVLVSITYIPLFTRMNLWKGYFYLALKKVM